MAKDSSQILDALYKHYQTKWIIMSEIVESCNKKDSCKNNQIFCCTYETVFFLRIILHKYATVI